ncbi:MULTISPECIES: MarR family winged helix-turn-helix transcriptional regulator [unclassified Acinetobacter]|jgi:DNA-binding MarR family transcriptional regulator|uniref:MarR family winged helix-turn-helix transcriptional regulator n=1 Tax=unclassified Acinetobacter TaxID=196816 RepID=UPI000A34A1A5|nr:MarR family transcriptional regulator [Acinetobacter sp. ANC 4218]OTG70547.1 MarR family transcriptional regulator [Acinetobacter sp. ANC 4218]
MPNRLNFRASLLRCARLMSDEINTILLPHQLNYSLWQVLYVIQLKQGCTSIDIAEYLNVSKPSIAKRIHALIQLEVLDQVDTEDKRQKKLILSIKGQQLFAACSEKLNLFEQRLLLPLDQAAQNSTLNTLHKLMDHLQEMKGGQS